ncbi:MAG: hypothetical protein HYR64_03265 [Fimbriimonas ginsengisoli]|uniref:Uncharacterized protein n=1 Tax=Fimbriimonas ginsengisoli TaxID=1005039 RepID=A0A931LRL5_FIMGI|nr:hypothetical protein [Fimbriimonas ginsengisoli]
MVPLRATLARPAARSHPSAPTVLPRPTTLYDGGIWMHSAAERMLSRKLSNSQLQRTELLSVLEVARAATRAQPENAYWREMTALFLSELGKPQESLQALRDAQSCRTWNDVQTDRLQKERLAIETRAGSSQAWPYARVYFDRSDAPAVAIQQLLHHVADQAKMDSKDGLLLRYVVAKHGSLIRDGAKSLRAGRVGAEIVEEACRTVSSRTVRSVHRQLLARYDLINRLREAGFGQFASELNIIYRQNDNYLASVAYPDSDEFANQLGFQSVVLAALPSALLLTAVFGLLAFSLGSAIPRSDRLQAVFRYPTVFSVGVVLALLAYALTLLPLAGLALGLSGSFMIGLLGLTFVALLTLYFVLRTTASEQVLTALDYPRDVAFGPPMVAGLCLLIVGLVALAAPLWAFAQRLRTTLVLSMALRSFGSCIAITGVVAAILTAPIVVQLDHANRETLSQLVTNEPLFYTLRR